VDGTVTLQDLVQEIVGGIHDEYDTDAQATAHRDHHVMRPRRDPGLASAPRHLVTQPLKPRIAHATHCLGEYQIGG